MKKIVVPILLGLFLLPHFAYGDEAAKRQLAGELLGLHHAGEVAGQSAKQLDQMLLVQLGAADLASSDHDGFEALRKKTEQLTADEFNWDKLKEEYIDLYVANFSEDELRDIVAFSKSPAGQKLQKVNPVLVEGSRTIGQRHTAAVFPKIQKLVEAFVAANKTQQKDGGSASPPAPEVGQPEAGKNIQDH